MGEKPTEEMRRGSADSIRASGHQVPHQQAGYKTAICLPITPKSVLATREASIQIAMTWGKARYIVVSGPPLVTRSPGPASGACFGFPDSPLARPLAPSAPPELAFLCSPASRLPWPSLTSPCRAYSVTAYAFPQRSRHDGGMAWRPPRSPEWTCMRAWVLRHRGALPPSRNRTASVAFGIWENLGTPSYESFGAH